MISIAFSLKKFFLKILLPNEQIAVYNESVPVLLRALIGDKMPLCSQWGTGTSTVCSTIVQTIAFPFRKLNCSSTISGCVSDSHHDNYQCYKYKFGDV